MKTHLIHGVWTIALVALGVLTVGVTSAPGRTDHPAQVVPWPNRGAVARRRSEIIRENTFHHRGAPETFPCNSRVYLSLLNEPALTLALWKDLSASPVRLQQMGPNLLPRQRRQRRGGHLGVRLPLAEAPRPAVQPPVQQSPRHRPPRGADRPDRPFGVLPRGQRRPVDPARRRGLREDRLQRLEDRRQDIRPVLEKLLEDQVREAGWFVSLMGRLVASTRTGPARSP